MAEENAKVGVESALEKEIVVLTVKGLEIYVDSNMELRARIVK